MTKPSPAPVVMCPICQQDVPVRVAPSGALRIARHQLTGRAPSQGYSCASGTGWEVTEK